MSKDRAALVGAVVFFLLGLAFVDYAGIQTDEALFAAPLFRAWRFFSVRLFHHNVPVMELSYLGALKTWLYAPLLLLWHPTPALIRVPAILMGALTILMFGALLDRVHGVRAAWVGCMLLATDTSFLLTTVHDWGPVALQHLLLVAAMLLAVRWFQAASSISLAGTAFCCGLAFWDKAVFVWVFTGLLAGSLLFARAIRQRLTWRRAAIATGAFCLGALPLIIYNLQPSGAFATIRDNAHRSPEFTARWFQYTLSALQSTWDGSALFGYLVNMDAGPRVGAPGSILERASFAIHDLVGDRTSNSMTIALCGALLLLPLLWRTRTRKIMPFSAIAIAVAWMHMVLAGGGGAAHHTVLLWPLPHLFLAAAFAETSLRVRFGKWALAVLVAFLAIGNVLLTNQYLYQFIRNGAAESWTDAIYPLASGLKQAHASQVVLPEWGLTDSLCVLNQDKPPTRVPQDPFLAADESPAQKQADLELLSDANAIWVDRTPGHEISKGVHQRVLEAARRAGFEPVMLQTYCDRNGRPIFQTFGFTSPSFH
jgi:hypothetical protein